MKHARIAFLLLALTTPALAQQAPPPPPAPAAAAARARRARGSLAAPRGVPAVPPLSRRCWACR